ncbi:hypothetical protein KFE25_009713 [Diacronema lutheri]|uniref:Peptidase A1 domain-containing protein n=2 Tax=Diacronema lutheri TaxID=2081491 RepID=A0A8J6CDS2_DIALT|nr:hypothetical protein KFE25_009713 [Diacronema lutheri]
MGGTPLPAALLRAALFAALRPSGRHLTLPLEHLEPPRPRSAAALPMGTRYALAVVVGELADGARRTRMLVDTGSAATVLVQPWEREVNVSYALDDGGYALYGCAACDTCANRSSCEGDDPAELSACAADCVQSCGEFDASARGERACDGEVSLASGLSLPYTFVDSSEWLAPPCELLRDAAGDNLTAEQCASVDAGVGLPLRVRAHLAHPCSLMRLSRAPSHPVNFFDQRRLWRDVGGVLGMAQWRTWPAPASEASAAPQWWPERLLSARALGSEPSYSYALDLRPDGSTDAPPTLVLGGDWDDVRGVEWGHAHARLPYVAPRATRATCDALHTGAPSLFAFDLSACGQPLAPASSSWPVDVTSGAPCLTLPAPLFDALTLWAPVDCSRRADARGAEARRCVLRAAHDNAQDIARLSALEFALREGGPLLTLPLQHLLLPRDESSGRVPICLHSAPDDRSGPAAIASDRAGDEAARAADDGGEARNRTRVPIVLGAAALTPFLAIFQLSPDRARVGLAQQPGTDSGEWSDEERRKHRTLCTPVVACRGDERFEPRNNACALPRCRVYLQTLDAERATCGYAPAFRLAGVLIISIVALVDLGTFEVSKYIGARVLARAGAPPAAEGTPPPHVD